MGQTKPPRKPFVYKRRVLVERITKREQKARHLYKLKLLGLTAAIVENSSRILDVRRESRRRGIF